MLEENKKLIDNFFLGPYRGEGKKYSLLSKEINPKMINHINEAIVHLDTVWNYWENKHVQPNAILTVLFYYTSRWVRSVRSCLLLLCKGYHTECCIIFRHAIEVYSDLEYLIHNNKCSDWTERKIIDREDFRRKKAKYAKAHPIGRDWTKYYGTLSSFVHPKNSDFLVANVNIEEGLIPDAPKEDIELRMRTFRMIYEWMHFYLFFFFKIITPHLPRHERIDQLITKMGELRKTFPEANGDAPPIFTDKEKAWEWFKKILEGAGHRIIEDEPDKENKS